VIRNNTIFDSIYWGGIVNSHAVSFMASDPANPHTVEYNKISNPGGMAVSTKNGVHGMIVRYNIITDTDWGVVPAGSRCLSGYTGCSLQNQTNPGFRPGHEWKIYGNLFINNTQAIRMAVTAEAGDYSSNNTVYNNLFINNYQALWLSYQTSGNKITNNIFMGNRYPEYLSHSASTSWSLADFLPLFSSNNNLYWQNTNVYVVKPNWGGSTDTGLLIYTVSEMQSNGKEQGSLSADPMFEETTQYTLQPASPAIGAGDGNLWNAAIVDIGRWPNPRGALVKRGDLNQDGTVDVNDLLIVLTDFRKTSNFDPRADVNNDNVINLFDIVVVIRDWGT
jgi:parallel beta-helix repeat protein